MLVQRSSRSCRAALNGNLQAVRIGCIAPHADRFNEALIAFIQLSPNLVTTKNNHPPSVMEQHCCTKGERHAPISGSLLSTAAPAGEGDSAPLSPRRPRRRRRPPCAPGLCPPAQYINKRDAANDTPTHTSPASTAIRAARFLVLLSTLLSCTLAHIQWGYAPGATS